MRAARHLGERDAARRCDRLAAVPRVLGGEGQGYGHRPCAVARRKAGVFLAAAAAGLRLLLFLGRRAARPGAVDPVLDCVLDRRGEFVGDEHARAGPNHPPVGADHARGQHPSRQRPHLRLVAKLAEP
jgi:hypothetical protein